MGIQPRELTAPARRLCGRADNYGDRTWLENTTVISADFLKPPSVKNGLRAWDRIAVPTATASRSHHKIHKRIIARPIEDRKYRAVVAELESQSLEARKRARVEGHVVPYGGVEFMDEIMPDATGKQDLVEAREHVKNALQNIWRENLRLEKEACQTKKRSSFDPLLLTWIPRKRHNTRWPIIPPNEYPAFIAEMQPLIRFELHPSQLEEADCDRDDFALRAGHHPNRVQPDRVLQASRVPEPQESVQHLKKEKSSHRRRTLRPSLSTISEAIDEAVMFPSSTPGSSRSANTTPAKRWQATTDTCKTPTKVAESPLRDFTMSATPNAGDITFTNNQSEEATSPQSPADTKGVTGHVPLFNHAGGFLVPSPSNTEGSTNHTPVSNRAFHFDAPSTLFAGSTGTRATNLNNKGQPRPSSTLFSKVKPAVAEASSTCIGALPFFDQPVPEKHIEPEYEAKRRLSLDRARRSDRTSNSRVIKRVHNWMTGSSVGKKRRYSDAQKLPQQQQEPKRRHTLDVDAGMNPDIFGQLQSLPASAAPCMISAEILHTRSGNSHKHEKTIPAVSAKAPTTMPEKVSAQEEDVATYESEEGEESAEREEREFNAHGEEKDEIVAGEESEDSIESEEGMEGDSDMAYLHNFVQRSKSSKEERREHVPTAPIVIKRSSKKRRSGSMTSATSDAASPKARMTTGTTRTPSASSRMPLGEKDANKSPSPSKKRKLQGLEQVSAASMKKSRLMAPDLDDLEPTANKRRKRRRGRESIDSNDIFNPNMDMNQVLTQRSGAAGADGTGSRRSSRIATVQKTEPATIPVRLPGSLIGIFADNDDMPAVSTAGITNAVFQRKLDKHLANKTRTNTNKNRGGSVPVPIALASMAERSSDGDQVDTAVSVELKKGRSSGAKTVRWDETLARVQGEQYGAGSPVEQGKEGELEPASEDDDGGKEVDEHCAFPPQLRTVPPGPERPGNPVGFQLDMIDVEDASPHTEKSTAASAPTRRSSRAATASRLPKRGGAVAATAVAHTLAPILTPKATPRRASLLPAPSRGSKSGGRRGDAVVAAAAAGAAEARARLGMAGPGTPAPRRARRRGGRR